MPVSKESKISAWLTALREGWPSVRAHFNEWKEAVREEPRLIWQTPAIRYSVYVIAGVAAIWTLTWALSLMAPAEVKPMARTADFHVLCTNPGCGNHFIINRKFGFDDFPVVCPKCQQRTGERAARCVSPTCHGRWVVPVVREGEYYCPICNAALGKVE